MEQVTFTPVRGQLLDRRARLEHEIERVGQHADLSRLLGEVDAALARVGTGTYGICETCHEPIEQDRLLADPLVRFCLDHLDTAEQRALERDLQLASTIQHALLPPANAEFCGWQTSYLYRPSRVVSGDYFDCIAGSAHDFYFLLGDVSGKGVAAAMLMSHLHAMFRALVTTRPEVDVLMEQANRAFCESTLPSHYATLVCGRATASGDVELCNAGHPGPIALRAQGLETLPSTGLPLGMFCAGQFGVSRFRLEPGEGLLLCTDGVLEAEDHAGTPYGAERLLAVAGTAGQLAPGALIDLCADDLARFVDGAPYRDDVTVMAVRRLTV